MVLKTVKTIWLLHKMERLRVPNFTAHCVLFAFRWSTNEIAREIRTKEFVGGDHHLLNSLETGHGGFEQSYCNYQIMFKNKSTKNRQWTANTCTPFCHLLTNIVF